MLEIWTIGHSTRSIEEFLELLQASSIEAIADVRRHAGSRKYPHFNPEALEQSLSEAGIEYHAFVDLGGRRKTRSDSQNARGGEVHHILGPGKIQAHPYTSAARVVDGGVSYAGASQSATNSLSTDGRS